MEGRSILGFEIRFVYGSDGEMLRMRRGSVLVELVDKLKKGIGMRRVNGERKEKGREGKGSIIYLEGGNKWGGGWREVIELGLVCRG